MDKDEQKSAQAQREEKVLEFWKENNIFSKTLSQSKDKKEYVFYEGPPTANGKPGIHHLEARAFKDVIPRYKTMQGFHVRRKGGWDTHGLPVELQVEKKLGLTSKKAIEEYGIAKFNNECKESVWEYLDYWNKFTERIGYWVDQKDPYVTYHNNYIESVWNVLKKVDKQKLLYKDYKVVPWCPRCGTTLSSHELAQGYEDVKDLSVTAKFKVKGQENTYILAWTTTPWTLPGNVALAVGEEIMYEKVKFENSFYYVARFRKDFIFGKDNYVTEQKLKGSDLVGLEYEPLYPYLSNTISDTEKPKLEKAFRVYDADFVTTEDGTGVVHIAPMYGVDDFNVGTKFGLPKHHIVGLDGKYLSGTEFLEGRFVKNEEVAVDIIKDLAHRGLLFKKEKYEHSYPHCWRCHTALIYYARDSWYIRMSALRDKMVKENESINWEPSYIKEGRFGEWLKDIKDWAISRERYWGTPLPVWSCESCKKIQTIGSIEELKSKTKKSGNNYFIMRHGETVYNTKGLISDLVNGEDHLTDNGKEQVKNSTKGLLKNKIDIIIASPFVRTRETADIVANSIGINASDVIYDDRLHEMSVPEYEGKKWIDYHTDFPTTVENFNKSHDGNESYADVKRRAMNFLYEIENKYSNKNILIITHGSPMWLMFAGVLGYTTKETLDMVINNKDYNYLDNAVPAKLDFTPVPHNENYELDLHKPYIDEIKLVCDDCNGELIRTKEVMDVWFDSGCMPFAQDHYLYEKGGEIKYPADFICEAIDQTRGWFYTLHAVGVLMGRGKAFKNVICLGHLLDASGKKMSKSLGNVVDPWIMIEKYGVDTLRLWMYSVNQPGESKNFDEKTVAELRNKVFNLLYNILAFYELYRDKDLERSFLEEEQSDGKGKSSLNVLDQWIVARLNQVIEDTTKNLDNYKLLEPVRDMRLFIDELSTWYVRRSRERLKDGDVDAKKTLYYVLKTLSKVMAPFAPFTAEDIWQKLRNEKEPESIHLTEWTKVISNLDKNRLKILEKMEIVRNVITKGLELRQKAGIKIRQPLQSFSFEAVDLEEYYNIIKDELNVKEIIPGELNLDIHITEELKQEGQYRELVRAVQDMRKKQGLNPSDIVTISIQTSVEGQELINKFRNEFMKTVSAKEIQIKENVGTEIKIDELVFIVSIS